MQIGKCVALYQSKTRENVCVCICPFVSVYSLACLSICSGLCLHIRLRLPYSDNALSTTNQRSDNGIAHRGCPCRPSEIRRADSCIQDPAHGLFNPLRFRLHVERVPEHQRHAEDHGHGVGDITVRDSVRQCLYTREWQQLTTARTRVSARTIHAAWSLNSLGAHSDWRWAARPTYRRSSPSGRISCRQRCCRPA